MEKVEILPPPPSPKKPLKKTFFGKQTRLAFRPSWNWILQIIFDLRLYIFHTLSQEKREREDERDEATHKTVWKKSIFSYFLTYLKKKKKMLYFFSLSHFTAFLKGFFFGWSSFGRKKKETSFAEWSTIVFSFDLPDSHRNPNLFLHHSPFKCVLTRKKILLGVSASRQEWQLFPHVEILARILSYFLWHPVSSLCVANTTSRSPLPAPLSPPPPPPLPLHLLPHLFICVSNSLLCAQMASGEIAVLVRVRHSQKPWEGGTLSLCTERWDVGKMVVGLHIRNCSKSLFSLPLSLSPNEPSFDLLRWG